MPALFVGRFKRSVGLAAIAALAPIALIPQSGTSTISGFVKDASGAAIPGAQARVVNEDTGLASEAVTNQEGLYRVGSLVPGSYRVEIVVSGFAPATRRPIRLEVGQTLAIDATLEIEEQTE